MWVQKYNKYYPDISPEQVWKIWTDVNNWSNWHQNIAFCKMTGKFEVGNHFILKPKKAPTTKVEITAVNKLESFTDCTHFFGAKMFVTHSMIQKQNGLILFNEIKVTGPLRWIWIKLVAEGVAKNIPREMDMLVKRIDM